MSELDYLTLQHDAEVQTDAMYKGFNIADPERNAHGEWIDTGAYRIYMSIVDNRAVGLSGDIELTIGMCRELKDAVKTILSEVFNCDWFESFTMLTDAEGYGTSNENDARYVVIELRSCYSWIMKII